MTQLTKFDVILYLSAQEKIDYSELVVLIKKNLIFQKTSERRIQSALRDLRKENLVTKEKNSFSLNFNNGKLTDVLAFLLWCKKDSVDYNVSLENKNQILFKAIFENYGNSNSLEKVKYSKPTIFKIIKTLDRTHFVSITKKKPLNIKAQVNDKMLFLSNIFGYNFSSFEKSFDLAFSKKQSEKLKESLIKLHVYSTTVTEGNTATEKDVENVLKNFSTQLSPKEVLEIVNAKSAIDELYKIHKTEDLSIDLIKKLHKILMTNLLENPGEFFYSKKRIIGSATKLPDSKIEIDTSMQAMINFYEKYKNKINPPLLASIIHFIFVSVHPFMDGNGRVSRLIHSLILLKNGFPIFAFDPNYRNIYFDLLDKGRSENIEDFVKFCLEKHKELIEKI